MSYCRFSNTLEDLKDCHDNMENDLTNLAEIEARKELVILCQRITELYLDEFGDDDD